MPPLIPLISRFESESAEESGSFSRIWRVYSKESGDEKTASLNYFDSDQIPLRKSLPIFFQRGRVG
jgi:hypothetical protein